jgi:hypothetical protein
MNPNLQSDEEVYASWFFEELLAKGFIKEIIYQPPPFILAKDQTFDWDKPKPTKKEPNRTVGYTSTFLKGAEYTPDIKVIWTPKARDVFYTADYPKTNKCNLFIAHEDAEGFIVSIIEVKPVFDDNNMTREVILKHKWVYSIHGIYVNMFIRDKAMPKLFTPERYILTQRYQKTYTDKKKGIVYRPGDSKIKWKVRTLEEYLLSLK